MRDKPEGIDPSRSHPQRRAGFTVIELLITLSVIALLLAAGGPAFRSYLAETRARTAMAHMQTLFAYARFEAVHSGQRTTLCALNAIGHCSSDWNAGHTVSVFHDRNNNRRLDTNEAVKRSVRWPVRQGRLAWRASLAATHLTFDSSGATWQNGTLIYCPRSGDARLARALVISQTGRSYLTRDHDGDGIREDRNGVNLVCTP